MNIVDSLPAPQVVFLRARTCISPDALWTLDQFDGKTASLLSVRNNPDRTLHIEISSFNQNPAVITSKLSLVNVRCPWYADSGKDLT